MRPPPPIIPPCRCTDDDRTHDDKGRCSAIPPCCRRWFEAVWIPTHDDMTHSQRRSMVALRWGYVPCPSCRQCGAKVQVRTCAEVTG